MKRRACILPGELDGRDFRGDLDIAIDARGTWLYNDSPIEREYMVRLFADMLKRDANGDYWLVSETEMGRIQVADAPLLAVDFIVTGSGEEQRLNFVTNTEQLITATIESPLMMKPSPVSGEIMPYLVCSDAIEAKLTRAAYYAMVELAVTREPANPHDDPHAEADFGVWSAGEFFPLIFPVGAHDVSDA